MHPLQSHQRQVHLDFHTSPLIPDVGVEFDAKAFVETFRRARVNSVTVFAKCHHGMCYYPTSTGTAHPALHGRDLLGEQIEALHRAGIRAPVYTTIAWEEDVAQRFPQWRQMHADGTFARVGNADPTQPPHLGGWWFNNYLHPEYQDYIEAHIRELFDHYEIDGLFLDIVMMDRSSCWSETSVRFREKHGLMGRDAATHTRFETVSQQVFAKRFTALVRGLDRQATIFYNSPNPLCADARYGVRPRHSMQTHWELESLPSGFWGYHHFPRLARAFGHWGKPWLGMTGRFQRMWGDFGGLKPQAALEYECFRSQALGGANSVGDQLPPRSRLDAGAYDLIGAVYTQCEAAEPFYAKSVAMPQVGIVAPGDPSVDAKQADQSLEGAVQMCEEAHYDAVVLDDASTLDGLDLIILPDSVVVTPILHDKLTAFVKRGGKLIASNRSGFIGEGGVLARDGASLLPGMALKVTGETEIYPTYWRAKRNFSAKLSRSDRVVYEAGLEVTAGRGVKVLVERVPPYFRRTDLTFSSHFQTPPVAKAGPHAAVFSGEGWVYFADPIFREYRHSGNVAVRDAWRVVMRALIGPASFGDGLPSTILLVPRRRGRGLLITLLHYIPTRKALSVDMIEECSSFAGERLNLPNSISKVIDFETGERLERGPDGSFVLPFRKGRLLLSAPGYFGKITAR